MLPITINGNKFQIPEQWHEVTFAQAATMERLTKQHSNKAAAILSALTGLSYEVIINTDFSSWETILPLLQFTKEPLTDDMPAPTSLEIDGHKLTIQRELKDRAFGMYADAVALITTNIDSSPFDVGAELCAIYLQQQYTAATKGIELRNAYMGDQYDDMQVKELKVKIEQMPVTDILPLAGFFLQQWFESEMKKLKRYM